MKTIKFRAWCPTTSELYKDEGKFEMYPVTRLDLEDISAGGFATDSVIEVFDDSNYWQIDSEHTKLMQYTGLKDWHKKEIYEGDIVRFTEKDGLVEYMDEVINDMHTIYDHCWEKNVDYSDIRVIGNIYENPELL